MWTYPDDNTSPVITAREHIFASHSGASAPELPETALLFYMGGAIEHLLNTRPCVQLAEKLPRFLYGCPVYGYKGVCFLDGGRGAPQAADTLETLAALGVKRVLSIGMCGSFVESVPEGTIVVPNRAYSEEGTSLHYYPAIEFAEPDAELQRALMAMPNTIAAPIVTTDAVFRQTYYKERLWREKGAVGVDMETSALFSVGRALGLRVAAALMVSDCHPLEPGAHKWAWKMTKEMRAALADNALAAIGL